jgi:hypothetical protein
MRSIRWWIGLVLGVIIVGTAVTLAWTPGCDPNATGGVWGYVTYNGQPVNDAAIFFVPAEGDQGLWVAGTIHSNGSYSINSSRPRAAPGRVRYKICVVPNGLTPGRHTSLSSESAAGTNEPGSPSPESPASQKSAASPAFPKRFHTVHTSGLEVTLGPEPTRIDVNLTD